MASEVNKLELAIVGVAMSVLYALIKNEFRDYTKDLKIDMLTCTWISTCCIRREIMMRRVRRGLFDWCLYALILYTSRGEELPR